MMAGIGLVAFAVLAATVGAFLLRRSSWPERAPRLGILAWQVLSGSVFFAVLFAGLSLALPAWPFGVGLAELLDTCVAMLRAQYTTPGGAAVGSAGLVLAVLVLSRTVYTFGRAAWTAGVGRSAQRERLALLARHDPRLDVLVLDHGSCAAYCVPGHGGRVVLTSAALDALDDAQLTAVLHHERAHLQGRHHLVIWAASALRTAFPFVPAFRWAEGEIGRLAEMLADDAAVRRTDRLALATALVRLAGGAAPRGALGAGGHSAVGRVRRLATPIRPLGPVRAIATAAALTVIALVPVAIAVGPAFVAISANFCPIELPA